jgi:hypothetical protein
MNGSAGAYAELEFASTACGRMWEFGGKVGQSRSAMGLKTDTEHMV